jgi:hypothetical protein
MPKLLERNSLRNKGGARRLQSVEQALDMVAISVAPEVAAGRLSTVCFGRDDRQDAAPKWVFPDGAPVISPVVEQGFRFSYGHVEQHRHGPIIRHLTPCREEPKRASLTVTASVDLARETAAASSKALLIGPPLAPAA